MPALPHISWFLGVRQSTGMSDCHENARAEGTLECPSADGLDAALEGCGCGKGGVEPPHSKALRAFPRTVVS
jgi:hypothetical protein